MVKVYEGSDQEYYMDGYLHSNLSIAKKVIREDWDFLYIIDGKERSGKSLFAQQVGKFVDPSLNIDKIVFTPEQFEQAVDQAEPYSCIIYDEAYGGLGSRATMSTVNRTIVKMLTEIGYKNLFILIVLPSIHILDHYVSLWRSRGLFHIYTGDKWERGFFCAYNEDSKRELILTGKKIYSYKFTKPDFYGRFTNKYTVNKEEYLKKKREATKILQKKKETLEEDLFNEMLFKKLLDNPELNHNDRMRILEMPKPTYFYKLRATKKSENY